jgi:hypothetical protein
VTVDTAFFRRELSRFAACGREWIVLDVKYCLGRGDDLRNVEIERSRYRGGIVRDGGRLLA